MFEPIQALITRIQIRMMEGLTMTRPTQRRRARFWLSSGLAVVMAALGGNTFALDTRTLTESRYDLAETARRIEQSAARRGLAVFTRVRQNPVDGRPSGRSSLVIVLETAQGGTPVVMDEASDRLGLPLSLVLTVDEVGATQVRLPAGEWAELPPQLAHDVAGLPAVVADALNT